MQDYWIWKENFTMDEKRHCLPGHTHKYYETVLVGRASLVPHHLLVSGSHRTVAAAGAAHTGTQLAEARLPAAKAHAAAETSWGAWKHTEH